MLPGRVMTWLVRIGVCVACAVAFGTFTSPAWADRAFTPRFSTNDTGNIAMSVTR